ncbi:uncharacterized protein N0V89_012589 [Didymosphaeria variabile]|uniref:Uncharacterized protein n=1 Tax=Didymosphaeria variabile TaxID=1932322 RepID=A0A9W8XAX9_9PLEO|nr:uncharacterized protein N0V89_012589 [Didymosphaeria variabile]KAJ4344845.1 hypothetical protein N0V89_012589 [Didymosphaeria variabile]
MGKFSRFVRKATGRGDKQKSASVGPARTATMPRNQQIGYHSTITLTPSASMLPSPSIASLGPARIIALPTLDPIQPVSPIRMSTTIQSTPSVPRYSLAYRSEAEDKSSSPRPAEDEEESSQQPEPWGPLSRDITTDTLYRPPTPPRLTSASFARLPEYIGSSDSSDLEVPRTADQSDSSEWDDESDDECDDQSGDSDTLGMLSPIARPTLHPTQEDVFSSSSSPAELNDGDAFRLVRPPTYHALPPSSLSTPSRPSYRRGNARIRDQPTPSRGAYAPTTQDHGINLTHRRIRRLTPYPAHLPPFSFPPPHPRTILPLPMNSIPASPTTAIWPPHAFPPTPSSELRTRRNSFSTRMDPLPSSSPTLPRTDDDGLDLQEFLLLHPYLVVGGEDTPEEEEEEEESTADEQNWVSFEHEDAEEEAEKQLGVEEYHGDTQDVDGRREGDELHSELDDWSEARVCLEFRREE